MKYAQNMLLFVHLYGVFKDSQTNIGEEALENGCTRQHHNLYDNPGLDGNHTKPGNVLIITTFWLTPYAL
jgi:hypothetical protein